MDNIELLQKRLLKIEKQLEKVRGCSPLTHGWQTQRYAKASCKWDMLAKEKMEILQKLDESLPVIRELMTESFKHGKSFGQHLSSEEYINTILNEKNNPRRKA